VGIALEAVLGATELCQGAHVVAVYRLAFASLGAVPGFSHRGFPGRPDSERSEIRLLRGVL